MKRLLLVLFLLGTYTSYGQCISVKELRAMFTKDMEAQDAFLEARGYAVSFSSAGVGIEWTNKRTQQQIKVDNDKSGEVWQISYFLYTSKSCYDQLRSQLAALGLKKDDQYYNSNGELYYFYSNSKYGVEFSKWTKEDKRVFYKMQLMRKQDYEEEIQTVKGR